MKVYAADFTFDLIEANVVKPLKTSASDSPDSVVWDQEVLFPPHENVFLLCNIPHTQCTFSCVLVELAERTELSPMV